MARNSRNSYGFGIGGPLPALAPTPIISTRDPATTDISLEVGTTWINTGSNQAWTLTSILAGSATWSLSSPGASDVDTLTGDAGGAISPAAGNITLAGGTNLATAGAANTITFNLDAAITLATSVTSPLYTAGAGVDTFIEAVAGQDIVLNMADAAGATSVLFTDSADATVFSVDSNGNLPNLGAITTVGAFTQTGGAVSISEDNAANAVGIGNGTTARAIDIGSSAAAHTITIGSATGAASLDLLCGTGNFTLEGNVASTYDISNTGVNTGAVNIAGGTGARTITIGGGGTGAKTINIGAAASADLITIGDATGAGSLDLVCGTGNFTLEGNTATTYDISNTGVNTGTVNIAGGTGARAINIGLGGTGAKGINIGTAASADQIVIGDTTGASLLDLRTGTGNFTLEGNVASTYDISATGVNTGTVRVASGTGARTVEIGGGGTGAKTINIGAAASADLISIGDATGAGSLDLACGTGNFTLEGNVATTYQISNTGVNTGQVDIAGGTGARTINIGAGGTGAKTINIGAAASADVITIGDATGAGSLDLVCGTGNMTLTSTGAGDITINSDDTLLLDSDGVLELNSSAGIISIGNDADAFDMNFGTGAAQRDIIIGNATGTTSVVVDIGTGAASFGASATDHTTTIGSTTGASPLILQGGTTDITLTGTVKEVTSEFTTRSGDSVTFQQNPVLQSILTTGAAPTGATGDVNIMHCQDGIVMEQFVLGAGQTIIAPRMDATGLSVAGDQTATEGYEYNFGAARTNSRHAFTIGTSAAFFFEVAMNLTDVSAGNPFIIGFRKSEANNAAYANYTDYAVLGILTGTSATNVVIIDELNGGGQNITNTTDAWTGGDGGTTTLRVLVSAAGVVTYTIDGVAPTVTAAFTFDTPDVVVPFIHLLQGADLSPVHLISMKAGFQA